MITIDEALRRQLLQKMADTINEHADHLTDLDRAIGDGDHGSNMARGFTAVMDEADSIVAKSLPEALKAMGMKLVMTVGGASGPLFGTLFMTLGKNLNSDQPTLTEFSEAVGNAVDALKARGKSDFGQKTLLDVLGPVSDRLNQNGDDLIQSIGATAAESAENTIPMQAIKGRASFLGERSVGHMDPGACSTMLLIQAVCEELSDMEGIS